MFCITGQRYSEAKCSHMASRRENWASRSSETNSGLSEGAGRPVMFRREVWI